MLLANTSYQNGIVLLSIEYQTHYNMAAAPSLQTSLVLRKRHANSFVAARQRIRVYVLRGNVVRSSHRQNANRYLCKMLQITQIAVHAARCS
jgi:predicted TIM-barrel enzyme